MGAMLGSAAQNASATGVSPNASAPPAAPERAKGPVFNVYAQEIDPKNMMPAANNSPAPGQAAPLEVERVKSTIPKGGVDGTWLYPSPQMFYNSLVRKNKADGVDLKDVSLVVAIHNEMNERTWSQLLEWEKLHSSEHLPGEPALRRFMGNPYELTPKSRIKAALGFGFPFDRHDWYIDRGGRSVHYIIDYFYNPNGSAVSPTGPPAPLTGSIHVDVRPAVEDVSSVLDRLRRFPGRMRDALSRPRFFADGIDPSKADPEAIAEAKRHVCESNKAAAAAEVGAPPPTPSVASAKPPTAADLKWAEMDKACAPLLDALKSSSDEDRAGRQVALNYCMGRVLCPSEASQFLAQLEAGKKAGVDGTAGSGEEAAFAAMTQCVIRAGRERTKSPAMQ